MLQCYFVIGLQSVQLLPAGSTYTFTVAGLLLLTASLTTSENTYRCTSCGHRGQVHLDDDSHQGEARKCESCGDEVTREWDGGVQLVFGNARGIRRHE